MSPAALVLDFDGTLVDTESANMAAHAREYARWGVPWDPALIQAAVGTGRWTEDNDPLVRLAGLAGGRFVLADARARVRADHVTVIQRAAPRPGVVEVVTAARAAGVPVAVASSSPHDWVDPHLARLGLAGQVTAVCCAEDVTRTKPHPDLYQLACRRVSVEPGQAVAVEDSANGVRSAVAAGLFCLAVPNPVTAGHDLAHAHLRAESLAELGWSGLRAAFVRWRTGVTGVTGGPEPVRKPAASR